ncbi:hypothetical protein [Methylobacterium sp. 1030]|uniref:hypothetical protein n=1 Tax=Methylobacterium sp. 1030 TaxID=3156404 RepID=UPI00105340FA
MARRVTTGGAGGTGILVGLLGLCLAGPALAGSTSVTARPGERVRLDGYATHETRPGCPSVPAAAIELVTPPRGGRIEQRREFLVLGQNIDGTPSRDGCQDVERDARTLYYTARPDFAGHDTVSVIVTFVTGEEATYTYRITVPEGEGRRAPAVSQAPAPRDAGLARPAPAARAAPAERATPAATPAPAPREASTGDFLRDAVRGAVPATRPAPAAPPPKAAEAAAPVSGTPAPPPPQQLAPPRPPAAPQL